MSKYHEYTVQLRRNAKGLGIIFDEGNMSVRSVVPGCVAAEEGTVKEGDVLLSVKRDEDGEVYGVHANENLAYLFPPGDHLFQLRFMRKQTLTSPDKVDSRLAQRTVKWIPPIRRNPSILASASFCDLRAISVGPHAFHHVPLNDKAGSVHFANGSHAALVIQSAMFHLNGVMWLTTAEPINLSDGELPSLTTSKKWQPSSLSVSRVGISCQPAGSHGKKGFFAFGEAPCSMWMMRTNQAVIGLCIGAPSSAGSKVLIIAAGSTSEAAMWLLLLGGRLMLTDYNIPDLELRENIAAFQTFDENNVGSISLTDTQLVASALGRELSLKDLADLVSRLELMVNLEMTLNLAQFVVVMSSIRPTASDLEDALIEAFCTLDPDDEGWISHEALQVLPTTRC